MKRATSLRRSLLEGTRQVGMFSRLRDPDVAETFSSSPLDFLVLDAENGSLGRDDISASVFACRAHGLPVLVRVPEGDRASIQHAVTVGATGVIVPHIASAAMARDTCDFTRKAAIERAYAGMGRPSAQRRLPWSDMRDRARENLVVIMQIDEVHGFEQVEAIAAERDIDALFIGSLSLAIALGMEAGSAAADAAMERICAACRLAGRRLGMHLSDGTQARAWMECGVNLFVAGNDYSLLLEGAERACAEFDRAC